MARRTWARPATVVGVLALLIPALPAGVGGQEEDTTVVVTDPVQPLQEGVEIPDPAQATPGGAFLRAVLIPGWGHASIGSYTRAGFYFTAEMGTAWMLHRISRRESSAEDRLAFQEALARERLRAEGIEDPVEIEEALEEDATVGEARQLVEARDQQFQDWMALGIFLVFLSGADAFVSAHLADFPEPIRVGARPVGNDRIELGISVPLPRVGRHERRR